MSKMNFVLQPKMLAVSHYEVSNASVAYRMKQFVEQH
jgi:hypothetical protein